MAHGSNRPLSPHLQIYRLPFTALTSVFHRATGVALSAGTLLLVAWLVAAALGAETLSAFQTLLGTPIGLLVLLGWSFSLFYHLAAGIRHLVWDAGRAFDNAGIDTGAWAVIVASVALTAVAWVAALYPL